MNGVAIVSEHDLEWKRPADDWPGKVAPGEPEILYKFLHLWDDGRPALQRIRYEPGHFEAPHSHDRDEILYLFGGELKFGDRTIFPGMTVLIPADTRYSFLAGQAGADLVLFRTR